MKSEMNWATWDTLRGILKVHFNTDQTYNQKSPVQLDPFLFNMSRNIDLPK